MTRFDNIIAAAAAAALVVMLALSPMMHRIGAAAIEQGAAMTRLANKSVAAVARSASSALSGIADSLDPAEPRIDLFIVPNGTIKEGRTFYHLFEQEGLDEYIKEKCH